jgi:hypothetical protein
MKAIGRILTRILIGILALAFIIFAGVGAVGLWAYQNPLKAFHQVQKYFLPDDLKVVWKDVHFAGDWLGGLDFKADLTIEGLDISKKSPLITVPLEHVRIQASLFPLRRHAILHLVEASAEQPIVFRPSTNATASSPKNPFQQLQGFFSSIDLVRNRLPIEAVNLRVKEFYYDPKEDGEPLEIKAEIQQALGAPMSVAASLASKAEPRFEIAIDGTVDLTKLNSTESFLAARINLDGFGVTTTQTLTGSYKGDSAKLSTKGALEYKKNKLHLKFTPVLSAVFDSREANLHLFTDVSGIPGRIQRVEKLNVDFRSPLEADVPWSDEPSGFSAEAPVKLPFVDKSRRAKMESACDCKLPQSLVARAEGKVWLRTLLTQQPERRPAIEATVKIESVKNRIFVLNLAGSMKVEKEAREFLFFPRLDSTASVRSFKSLSPMLDAYNILIPAPLDVLDGRLLFKANGPVASDSNGSTFPISLDTDLKSASQKVKISSTATMRLDTRFTSAHFNIDTKVVDLNLDLPPLDPLGGLPRIAPDSRFKKSPEVKAVKAVKSVKFKLSFNFEVETQNDGAIRLASKYFKPYLPLTLKIQSNGAKENSGFIQSEPLSVTYLRRTVRVENLRIGLDTNTKGDFPMRGRLSVKQTDYTVFIDIEGTTKNPNVTMSSEPYLPQNDIIAVLLYDRVNDQLVSGDAETSGSVQAAIADRAIGLFGIWAFAATPIKSFTYNPVAKVYTATVAVADGLTAGIGTNWEESARLELRKRVSKRWSLTAAWAPATQEDNATTKLVLQWEKRF